LEETTEPWCGLSCSTNVVGEITISD